MLPRPALAVLVEYLDKTEMGVFITLAQVNRESRSFFLSDYAWERFDVHQARGIENIYVYGDYRLEGIAAHYFNWLSALPANRRGWHFPHSEISIKECTELYDQLNLVTKFSEVHSSRSCYSLGGQLVHFDQRVWQCWMSHPLPEICDWRVPSRFITPFNGNRALFLRMACHLSCAGAALANPYIDDREANFTLLARGHWRMCSQKLLCNEEFMLEALERNLGSMHMWVSQMPGLMDKLYIQNNEKVIQWVTENSVRLSSPLFDRLRCSESFVLQCVERNPKCLEHAGYLRNNREIVAAAISMDPNNLKHADGLCDDLDIVSLAVVADPTTLRWASRRLRRDVELMRYCRDNYPQTPSCATRSARLHLRLGHLLKKAFAAQ